MRKLLLVAVAPLAGLAGTSVANAHAVCGDRVFPVTLTIDDPGVADEASVPTFSYLNNGAAGSHEYDLNFEYDKRITPDLGIGIN